MLAPSHMSQAAGPKLPAHPDFEVDALLLAIMEVDREVTHKGVVFPHLHVSFCCWREGGPEFALSQKNVLGVFADRPIGHPACASFLHPTQAQKGAS